MEVIESPALYDHQEEHVARVRAALAQRGRVIMCAPTGSGKTRMAKWILASSANRTPSGTQSGRSLFAVHRRGLVDNAQASFAESPELPHGVVMSGRAPSYGSRVQVASIDTLLSWFVESDEFRTDITFDLIVYDECHSHHSKLATFLKYHDQQRESMGLSKAFVVGLSATPQGKGLADVYSEIVAGPETQWLIDNEFLSPMRYFRATQGRLDKLVKSAGDFTNKSQAEAMDGLAGDLVRDWRKYADGRPTIGFFPRISHAKAAMEELRADGIRVAYVDGSTPDDERRSIFAALNSGDVDYLANCQVVERGTDIPAASCIQLCVAIGSVARYRQMIGRGARVHPGKTDCLILDHGGNVARHGFFEDDPEWSLDITSKDAGEVGTKPTIECPQCQAIYRGGKCASCGYEPTAKERRGVGLEFDGSELKEVTKKDKPTETKAKSAEELMVAAIYMAGRSGRTWRQCVGIFYRASERQGTSYRVPRAVTVGGHRYSMIRADSSDTNRRVASLFPFVAGGHGGAYLIESTQAQEAPY